MIQRFRRLLATRHNVRAHFWQSMANYSQTGGGLLIGIVLARMLNPEVFGEFVSISALLAFMMIPLSFSAAQVLVSDGGRTLGLFERVMGMVWVISALKLTVLAGYIVVAWASGNGRAAVVGFFIGLPLAASDWLGVIRADLEGRGKFKPNFFAHSSGLAVHAVVAIGLVWAGWEIFGLALGGFAAFLPQMLIYLRSTDRRLSQARVDIKMFQEQFSVGFWLWLNSVAEAWFSRIDKIFLGKFGGDVQLGYYNRAFQYGPISHLAMNSLMTNATVRALASAPSRNHRDSLFFRTTALVLTGGVVNWALWWWFSDPLVVWIFGPQWVGAIPVFQVFAFLSLALGFAYMPVALLLSLKAYQKLAICRILGLLLFVVVLASLYSHTQTVQASDVAWAFCGSMCLMGVALAFSAWHCATRFYEQTCDPSCDDKPNGSRVG